MKPYKLRSMSVENGVRTCVELPLEFEGERAFVIWDSVRLGSYKFKARLEIDPHLLQKTQPNALEFLYSGHLELPRPQNN